MRLGTLALNSYNMLWEGHPCPDTPDESGNYNLRRVSPESNQRINDYDNEIQIHRMVNQSHHAGEESLPKTGPLIPPIYQNSTFQFETAEECVTAFTDEDSGYVYTRWGNPTQSVLENKIAVLECGEAALATASGMAAVSTALLTLLAHGDHVVAMDSLYSGSYNILNEDLRRMGIETTFVDATDPGTIEQSNPTEYESHLS